MQRIVVLCVAAVLAPTSALVCRDTSALTRRGLLKQTVAAAAPLLTLGATPVWANTQAELSEQSAKSIDNEQKRAAFAAAQKVYKKAWRKELANLEYLTTDEERIEAIRSMLIVRPSLTLALALALGLALALALTLALALLLTLTLTLTPHCAAQPRARHATYARIRRRPLSTSAPAGPHSSAHARTRPPTQMIQKNNGDIPEGVRRQDLDQIYKRIKEGMGKTARMAFLQLDEVVRNAERVKNMAEDDGL